MRFDKTIEDRLDELLSDSEEALDARRELIAAELFAFRPAFLHDFDRKAWLIYLLRLF